MNKFKDVSYTSQSTFKLAITYFRAINKFSRANSAVKQERAIAHINFLRNGWITNLALCNVRNAIDMNDKYYADEYKKVMSTFVVMQLLNVLFYKRLTKSKYKEELKKKYGEQLFNIAEKQSKVMNLKVIKSMQKEYAVADEYNKLIAKAQVEFEGEKLNLSKMKLHMESKDEDVRKKACKVYADFFKANADKIDDIYDRLVKQRHEQAKKLGYDSYVELTYDKMSRDYTPEQVASYRQSIEKYIVPVTEDLRKRQAQRLGKDKLTYPDEAYKFTTGNAHPNGDGEWIVENMQKMFDEISPDTGKYFRDLTAREFMDLEGKDGKKQGGFCMPFPAEKSPFVFTNFNGTAHDVTVLTHECGHGYQMLNSMQRYDLFEYIMPTYEACEVHSMGMEFVAWPWYNLFFGENEQKAKFTHLSDSLLFIPYGVMVDEFQHEVYYNPDATPKERREMWKKIEKKYMPSKDYGEIEFFGEGTLWYRQQHIFNSPFYYIDYTLAQICAFQIWQKSLSDYKGMWTSYYNLCTLGGSKPFVELVEQSGLNSPFKDETIKSIVSTVSQWLDTVDDKNM